MRILFALAMALGCALAMAQSVTLGGSMGDKALLVINGTPRMVALGATVQGVKLVSVGASEAAIEVQGRRMTLQMGGAPASLGGAASDGNGSQIVLTAGSGGHFFTGGSINGRAVQFMVDTGATMVAMGQADAERIGLNYKSGQQGLVKTANGAVPVRRVALNSVRIGDVQVYNVEAVVLPVQMDAILLGNSFLTRFQMKRENDRLTLELRP
jgi:aspartyl protease family protein